MRIIIIGIGSIAKKHIKAIKRVEPKAEIFALRSSRDAVPYEDVKDFYEYDEIKKIAPDFIIISNPTSKHFETIQKLLPYGLPLFIEKPVFAELGHEDVIKEIEDKHILTYVACDMRFMDCLTWLHQYMAEHRNELDVQLPPGAFRPAE